WFKSDEAALVVGLTNSLFESGGVTSFILPVIFDNSNIEETSEKFFYISIVIVVSYGTFFFLTLFYVVDKPPSPPSEAENKRTTNGRQSLKTLFKNKNFLLLTITFALILGSSQSFTITLNQAVLKQFSNNHIVLSIAGILAAGSGIPGSLIAPTIMKKFPNYRALEIIYTFCYALSFLLYLLSLWTQSEWLLYVSVVGYGLSMNALFVLTLDFIVEVSFPFTESIVYSFSFMGQSLVALVEAPVVTLLTNNWGATNANFIYLGIAVVCLLLSLFVSNDMRRRKADCHEAEPLILHST
ncbi:feline leukemia virus subgroup C receptor-related protein 2-like protein, partial [Dinothrombium tinctorium]